METIGGAADTHSASFIIREFTLITTGGAYICRQEGAAKRMQEISSAEMQTIFSKKS